MIYDTLFDRYYNNYKDKFFKIKKLHLISHHTTMNTFHSFPLIVTNFIEKKLINYSNTNENKNNILFLTRSTAKHMPRNLDNQVEIEEYLKNNKVDVINPETISFSELINILRCYKKIIITWGSALVNLNFCIPNSEIIILKSKSYEEETIDLFNHIIKNKNLNIKIINSKNNIIDINTENILNHFCN